MDKDRIKKAIYDILVAIGEEPEREGLKDTPSRMADMYEELFSGLSRDPVEVLREAEFAVPHQEMVIVRDIPFYSMCEHHLLPFYGRVHIGYIPAEKVAGISKFARAVEILSRRLQIQERLTTQIADAIMEALEPQGVGVIVEAEHLCMIMRGVEKPGSFITTSAMRGLFRRSPLTRSEFLTLIEGGRR